MSPRTGRPKAENPKKNDIKVRLDDETFKRLNVYCQKYGIIRAEAIRQGIKLLLGEE